MSRLNDLLYQLRRNEPGLARDLEQEFGALSERRAFGLNFERHVPEAVELPGRRIRKGDKVRVLPPRGETPKRTDESLWRALGIDRTRQTASLERLSTTVLDEGQVRIEHVNASVDDLVVVAEFRDPIYPGLVSTGKVQRGGDKPFHAVINAENYHALETLLFTHRGKIDAIYIDPPYNTGAKDWRYNNDYVESDDLYRHSKWLAMMERRLLLAKELLNPNDSVLIVTIDEKEYLRLGLLLEQTFPEGRIQMVSSVINATGAIRVTDFTRTNEFIFFVSLGYARIAPEETDVSEGDQVRWNSLRRFEMSSRRNGPQSRPDQFFPIYIDRESGRVAEIGASIAKGVPRSSVPDLPGCATVWPLKPDGTEMVWGLTPDSTRSRLKDGYVKTVRAGAAQQQEFSVYYLTSGKLDDILSGEIVVTGRDETGAALVVRADGVKTVMPTTQWEREAHNAQTYGTKLLSRFVPGRRFPFPKSLYAIEDALRFFVKTKSDAVVLDFFAGSGTTAHAVMRLNKQDGGQRQCILVTNNEVGADEQKMLRVDGLRPGDPAWEQHGICGFITQPRIEAAITGRTPAGELVNGDYKFTDEFPMADGFEENVEFFNLTYEVPLRVASNREFAKVAPLLWLRAGSQGRRIDDISQGWDVADTYGVLADLDRTEDFLKAVAGKSDGFVIAYVVTDEDRLFESVSQELPDDVEPIRLYEAYLRNFEIESGRGAL